MKIAQDPPVFSPVTITLETPEEVALLEAFVIVASFTEVERFTRAEIEYKAITDFASTFCQAISQPQSTKEQNA